MKCLLCKKDLKPEGEEENRQPEGGGEVHVRFDFGSRHDQMIGFTYIGAGRSYHSKKQKILSCDKVVSYICDDCFEENLDYFEGWQIETETETKWKKIL